MSVDDIASEIFPEFEHDTQVRLYYFMNFMGKFGKSLSIYKRILSIVGIVVTILHIYILSRKSMRNSSTNIVMIGMATCDMGMMWISTVIFVQELFGRTQLSCEKPLSYFETALLIFLLISDNFFRRCVSWLAIMMATIRTIAVKNAKNRNFDYFSETKCGLHSIVLVLFLSFLLVIFQFFVYSIVTNNDDWLPPKDCPATSTVSDNTTVIQYFPDESETLGPYYLFADGVVAKIIPCVAFPILTAILIIELRRAKEIRRMTIHTRSSEKNDRTTALVTFIAVSFCIAEFPQGVMKCVELIYFDSVGMTYIARYISLIFIMIGLVNAFSHGAICYAMSTKYRTTFNSLFSCCCKNKMKTSNKSSTASVTNVSVARVDNS